MRVGVDVTPLLRPRTGIAVATEFVLDSLRAAGHDLVGIVSGWRRLWRRTGGPAMPLASSWVPRALNPVFYDLLAWPPVETMTGPLDVFVATNHALGPSRAAKNVALVHDVGRLRHPELYGYRQVLRMRCLFRRIRRFADHVVVPTAAMAREVEELEIAPAARISVIPWFPRDLPEANGALALPGVPSDRPLMLCVATLERHKNIALLIRAFRKAALHLPHDLVVAGGAGSGAREAFEAARGGRVHFVGHVGASDLGALYRRADLAVCPSLYEGFGLTLLEAMAAGCPVLAADIPAHREVAGDAAWLVSPRDEGAFASGLLELARDGRARADLAGRGLERSRQFSPGETRRRLGALIR